MTPGQSAAVERLKNALVLWPHRAVCCDDVRALLAVLDKAQQPPNEVQIQAAINAWFDEDGNSGAESFMRRMRAAIDAARASAGGAA